MTLPEKIQNLLDDLFKSSTIKPSYKEPHILYTIMLLGITNENGKGIGRYKIKEATGLGGGTVKTLVNRLKQQNLIDVYDQKQRGHLLTKKGKEIYKELIEYLPVPKEIQNTEEKLVLGKFAHYVIINRNNVKNTVNIGINQRDEAIKIGGSGASCLQYNGSDFIFPDDKNNPFTINITDLHGSKLGKNDYIVIGGAKTKSKSIIATIAATLTLFE